MRGSRCLTRCRFRGNRSGMHPDQIPPIPPQPMDATELAELRCALDDPRHASVGPVDKLIAAHDYYRARCEIIASDISEGHTAARVLAYALTHGWAGGERGTPCGFLFMANHKDSDLYDIRLSDRPYYPGTALRWLHEFCERHAAATGMAPLDVLAAIGAMP